MKKIIIIVCGVTTLTLMAFTAAKTGVKKMGDGLYEVSSPNTVSRIDNAAITDLLKKEYGLKSLNNSVALQMKDAAGKKTKFNKAVILKNSVFINVVDKVLVRDATWEPKMGAMSTSDVEKVLSKYAQ